jgi:RNA polymerase sigma-70 factor (sigma-E family)
MASTFEEYVAVRGAALVRFARVLAGDRHRAEDLVQEVLARAYLRWDRITRRDDPDVYVRQAIVNATRSWWRRRSNHEIPTNEQVDHAMPGDVGADMAERDELWRRIHKLPPRQRAVLVLRYYEDLDDDAIAAVLGCTRTTVRTHAMRALDSLRGHYPTPAAAHATSPSNEGDTHD